MVNAIFNRWPHLAKKLPTYDDARIVWKHRLETHFKNARARMQNNIPEILVKKNKYGKQKSNDDGNCACTVKRLFLVWGVPNYLPCYPPGETDKTMTRHQEKLRQQKRLPYEKKDSILVKKLRDTTFSHRRKLIVTQLVKIADLAIQYPMLCTEDHVNCII